MNDQDLLDVAVTWSFWDRPPPASIERSRSSSMRSSGSKAGSGGPAARRPRASPGPTPIQVTVDGATERTLHALDAFFETFPHAAEAVIVTTANFPDVITSLDDRAHP